MKKRSIFLIFLIIAIIIFSIIFTFIHTYNDYSKAHPLSLQEKKIIAHAGGALGDFKYLNNLESIENSYNNGIRLIELDIEFTTDNKPVMLHSWDGFVTKFFSVEAWKTYYYDEFKNFKMVNNWHQLTLDDTIFYMKNMFKEMYLVTDTKNDNKLLLDILATKYPYMKKRIIPQVYNQQEYKYAKDLGFNNIIYTLYASKDTPEQVIDFCKNNEIFAITMPKDLAYTDLPSKLSELGIYTYTHTINDIEEFKSLSTKGINGIYTDYLLSTTY